MTDQPISSRDNQYAVLARRVRDGQEPDLIFIEGKRLAADAIESDLVLRSCIIADDLTDKATLVRVEASRVQTIVVTARLFRSLADTENPQGIILIAERPRASLADIASGTEGGGSVVFLKSINNPSNLGAILRTSEAAGAAGIIISEGSADAYSPKSLRAAMGSAFRLPVAGPMALNAASDWARANRMEVVAADVKGARSYFELDWTQPKLIVFGSEAHGLSVEDLEYADSSFVIPMLAPVESLNLAAAAAVCLFEARRQRLSEKA